MARLVFELAVFIAGTNDGYIEFAAAEPNRQIFARTGFRRGPQYLALWILDNGVAPAENRERA